MPTIEERLARLEGKTLPAQQMRDEIYEDYLKLRMQVDDAESALRSARTNEIDIHKKLKMVREAYSREEAALLATDERAGGKNADERKANATNLVHEEKAEGGKLHGYWLAVLNAERDYEAATAEKEACIDHFSAVRYVMRMASGLANSLGW